MKKMKCWESCPKILPGSLTRSARNIVDIGGNLLHLEAHDQVSGKVSSSLGMVADRGSSGEGENIRDRAADKLEGVVLIARWNSIVLY